MAQYDINYLANFIEFFYRIYKQSSYYNFKKF